ncbi:MAG: type IX secretion system outer membrane channel protein PorV [Bacteroidetes bacterium]|nr:type IX secretion system outer membrane channel protein PorV [Bacteroidota bacterium]
MPVRFKFALFAVLTGLLSCTDTTAQINISQLNGQINTLSTAVPFLRITTDARAAAMGEAGIATSPDAHAIYWNPAKLSFAEHEFGIVASYTPWLRLLVDNVFLANISGYKRLNENQALGISIKYFYLGKVILFNPHPGVQGFFRAHEYVTSVVYARKLCDNLSIGLGLKYIYSNIAAGQTITGATIKPSKSLAGDISIYYEKNIIVFNYRSKISHGISLSNVGSKITYTEPADKDFIPTNIGIGTALGMELNENHDLRFALDVNKLLVLSQDSTGMVGKGVSAIRGMLGSFSDAPGGFSEELAELMFSMGVEYWYRNRFALRSGYFAEHSTKGNRKYLTAGLGLKLNVFGLNVSYLIPSNSQRNPLDNTIRFSLLYSFNNKMDPSLSQPPWFKN